MAVAVEPRRRARAARRRVSRPLGRCAWRSRLLVLLVAYVVAHLRPGVPGQHPRRRPRGRRHHRARRRAVERPAVAGAPGAARPRARALRGGPGAARSCSPAASRRPTPSPRRPLATTTSATGACPTRRCSRRSTAPAPGTRCGPLGRFLAERDARRGRAGHRRLPRLPGGGDRRGDRLRRHRVAHRLAASPAPSSSASSSRETAAVSVGRIIGYDRLFRIDHDLND